MKKIKLTGNLVVYATLFVCFICLFISGCISHGQSVGYVRTKSMNVFGEVTAMLDVPVMTVLWNFLEYDIDKDRKLPFHSRGKDHPIAVNDCFRSELVYNGVVGSEALFEIRDYLCQRFESVGTERLRVDQLEKKQILFHGTCITLLETSPSEAVMKIDLCVSDDT